MYASAQLPLRRFLVDVVAFFCSQPVSRTSQFRSASSGAMPPKKRGGKKVAKCAVTAALPGSQLFRELSVLGRQIT